MSPSTTAARFAVQVQQQCRQATTAAAVPIPSCSSFSSSSVPWSWSRARSRARPRAHPRSFSSSPPASAWPSSVSASLSRRHEQVLLVQARRTAIQEHILALEQARFRTRYGSRRKFCTSQPRAHGHLHAPKPGQERHVTFIDKEGHEHTFTVADGDNLLDIAQANDLEMEGACGGSCACSTCHVIVEDDQMFDRIPEATDDENDMLDLAFGLTETSRLGCQVKMSPELDGLRVKLPAMTRNLQAGDFEKR